MISKKFPLLLALSFCAFTSTVKADALQKDDTKHHAKEQYLVLAIGLKNVDKPMHKEDVSYHCAITNKEVSKSFSSADFKVRYINIGNNSIALLPLATGDLVLANVISADGAKYVGAEYTWWTKGNEATFYKDSTPEAKSICVENKG